MRFGANLRGIGALLAMLSLAALPGCALLQAGPGEPTVTYDLSAPAKITRRGRFNQQLVINDPVTVRAYDTENIVVKQASGQVSYFPNVTWTDRLPRLVQMRLVESFDNARATRGVGSRSARISSDLSLSVEIRAFQIDVGDGLAKAHINLYLKLIDDRAGAVISARGFRTVIPAGSDAPQAGVEALNAAFKSTAVKIVRWITGFRARHS